MEEKRTVLKGKQATQGQDFLVEARKPESTPPAGSGAARAKRPEKHSPAAAHGAVADEPGRTPADELLDEARWEAAKIVDQAQTETQTLRRETAAELKALREQTTAELQTLRDGLLSQLRQELEREYQERYAAAVKALEGAAAELRGHQEDYLKQIERPALELVLAVARQLLAAELRTAPEAITGLIIRAFQLLKPEQVVVVHVSAPAFERLSADQLLAQALAEAGIRPGLVELAVDETLSAEQFVARVNGVSVSYDLSAAAEETVAQLVARARTALVDGEA